MVRNRMAQIISLLQRLGSEIRYFLVCSYPRVLDIDGLLNYLALEAQCPFWLSLKLHLQSQSIYPT